MTKPELPQPSPSEHEGPMDLLEDAISWFTGRSDHSERSEAPARPGAVGDESAEADASVTDESAAGGEPAQADGAVIAEGDAPAHADGLAGGERPSHDGAPADEGNAPGHGDVPGSGDASDYGGAPGYGGGPGLGDVPGLGGAPRDPSVSGSAGRDEASPTAESGQVAAARDDLGRAEGRDETGDAETPLAEDPLDARHPSTQLQSEPETSDDPWAQVAEPERGEGTGPLVTAPAWRRSPVSADVDEVREEGGSPDASTGGEEHLGAASTPGLSHEVGAADSEEGAPSARDEQPEWTAGRQEQSVVPETAGADPSARPEPLRPSVGPDGTPPGQPGFVAGPHGSESPPAGDDDPDATAVHRIDGIVPPESAIDSEAGYDEVPEPPSSLFREEDVAPAGAGAAGVGGAAGLAAFATGPAEQTAAPGRTASSGETEAFDEEQEALRRAEEREARDRQLGKVQPLTTAPAPVPLALPTTYRLLPSFGLLLLRLVTAGIIGIRAFMHAMDIASLQKLWADHTILAAEAPTVAWVQMGVEAVVAIMLVFGLGTRIAGALLAALSVCLLTFMLWGAANPFQAGMVGFIGEIEVLLAAVGVFFLTAGGGRAAIDGTIHKGRIDTKNERLIA